MKAFMSVCCDAATFMEVGGIGHSHHCSACKKELACKDMYILFTHADWPLGKRLEWNPGGYYE